MTGNRIILGTITLPVCTLVGIAAMVSYRDPYRRRHARMAERTRALVPVLPQLIAAAERQLEQAAGLLHAAGAVPPGGEFTSDGISYLRTGAPRGGPNPAAMLFVQPAGEPGKRFDVRIAEDTAFWTWR